jgi:nucleotide-binding universal stress UspA family protein
MLNIRKILLPIDFQDTSLRIVHHAASLAHHFHSEIVLLHVVKPLTSFSDALQHRETLNSENLLSEFVERAEKELHESVRPEFQGLAVKCVVVKGDPSGQIVQFARDEQVNLIVMPTHGYGGLERFLIGSVTAKVIHDSDCPVWTAAHLPDVPKSIFAITHVLCPVTFSEHSRRTLTWAVEVAAEFKAKLTIAHVTPSVEMYGPGGTYVDRKWKDELVSSASEELAKLQQQVGTKSEVVIDSGDPSVALGRIAREIAANLLVVGGHASGGRLRSTGYGIISQSQIPVLSV